MTPSRKSTLFAGCRELCQHGWRIAAWLAAVRGATSRRVSDSRLDRSLAESRPLAEREALKD
jgi:hypothetical protein